MKCKFGLIGLLTFMFMSLSINASAQKNEVRVSYGDAIAFEVAGGLTGVISDIFSGSSSTTKNYGTYSVGYRYLFDRFGFGAELSYIPLTTNYTLKNSKAIDYRSNQDFFVILPTADYKYLKRKYVQLYASVGIGAAIGRAVYKGKTEAGEEYVKDLSSTTDVGFAFQLTPIGIRVGNDTIGGFVELSYGAKGFVCAGLSVTF